MNQNIQKEYHISPDGSGDFSSLFEALSALQDTKFPEETNLAENLPADPDFRTSGGDAEPVVLFLHSGIYRERIVIVRPGITIIGDDPQTTVITGGLYARMPMEDIGKRGTFRTFSCLIASHDITFKNVTFENSSGKGPDVGQALALYADGDRLVLTTAGFLEIRTRFLQLLFPQRRSSQTALWDRARSFPELSDATIIKTATWRETLILYSAEQPHTLKTANCFQKILTVR